MEELLIITTNSEKIQAFIVKPDAFTKKYDSKSGASIGAVIEISHQSLDYLHPNYQEIFDAPRDHERLSAIAAKNITSLREISADFQEYQPGLSGPTEKSDFPPKCH
jgi:hypothetical protein